jgi:SAM-dependent methyltransferase
VLGTEAAEVERLGLQHRVWRPRVTDAWRRAGFTTGQHLIDVGCGPGYATVDLAAIVGPEGRITALDRSPSFLEALAARAAKGGLENIDAIRVELDTGSLPAMAADGAWARWVFAFVTRPRQLLGAVSSALKPGAALVIFEYFNYTSWKLIPREPGLEEFVEGVVSSWRSTGGEPDIGLDLISWLPDLGFRIEALNPITDIVGPDNFVWQWPATFVDVGVSRLASLGYFTTERADAIKAMFRKAAATPGTRMITPGVVEIIARKL